MLVLVLLVTVAEAVLDLVPEDVAEDVRVLADTVAVREAEVVPEDEEVRDLADTVAVPELEDVPDDVPELDEVAVSE